MDHLFACLLLREPAALRCVGLGCLACWLSVAYCAGLHACSVDGSLVCLFAFVVVGLSCRVEFAGQRAMPVLLLYERTAVPAASNAGHSAQHAAVQLPANNIHSTCS
jgi:hypothetical protein